VAPVLDLAVQLAVRKSAGTTLPELHIGLGFQLPLSPQSPGVSGALAHVPAAFQNDGPQSHLRQQQGGQDATGAETDDQRSLLRGPGEVGAGAGDEMVTGIRAGTDAGQSRLRRQQGLNWMALFLRAS
jgi:hypothetical protein